MRCSEGETYARAQRIACIQPGFVRACDEVLRELRDVGHALQSSQAGVNSCECARNVQGYRKTPAGL